MIADAILWIALYTGAPLAPEHAKLLPELTPLAESLGMLERGSELADVSFRALQPQDHASLVAVLPSIESDRVALAQVHQVVDTLVSDQANAVVTSRRKSLYSTWSKMQRKDLPAAGIDDRLAVRVRVSNEAACYELLEGLHGRYHFDDSAFDDYIQAPKDNGYRSIHTVVLVPGVIGDQPVEVQIRTHAMHAAAENGDAAHWRYKRSLASVSKKS